MIDIGFTSVATEGREEREGNDYDDDGGKNAVESQISGFKCEIGIASFQQQARFVN